MYLLYSDLYAQRVTTGTVSGSTIELAQTGTQVAPAVTYNPDDDQYLVVWQDYEDDYGGSNYDAIWGRRFYGTAADGTTLGNAFNIEGTDSADSAAPAVTYFTTTQTVTGTYMVAWEQTIWGGSLNVEARRVLTDGTTLGSVFSIVNETDDQEDVALGFGPQGSSTFAAWTDGRTGNDDVHGRLVWIDGSLGSDYKLHPVTGDQTDAQVTYNGDDDQYLVVWEDYRAGAADANIYAQRVTGDGLLQGENITITAAAYNQLGPFLAYGSDAYLVAWRHYPGAASTEYDVYAAVISPTGTVVTNSLVVASGSGSNSQESPSDVVYNSDTGKFLVLYLDKVSGNNNIWSRHVETDGTMDTAVQVTSGSGHESQAVAAYDPGQDRYLVAMAERSIGVTPRDIDAVFLTNGGTVTPTTPIAIASGAADERWPDVALLGDNYVILWHDNRNSGSSGYDIYGQVVLTDGTLSGADYAISTASGDDRYPRLALDGSGGALAVWQSAGGGTGDDLSGRRLDSDGRLLGDTFTVLAAGDDQEKPALAGDGGGRFFLAWQDDRNADWDVYGQIFQLLQAGFSASPRSGAVPLPVQFSDASSPAGTADQWIWDFGDGTGTSTSQSPVYTYTMSGLFTVTLTVTDTGTGESDTLTRTAYIQAISSTVIHYTYDDLYRLTEASYTGEISATYEYAYDEVGNMTAYTETITSTTMVTRDFDDANRLEISVQGGTTTTYTYDDNGNLVTIDPPGASGTVRYGYDQRNLMITSTVDGSAVASFAYDGMNNRLRQVDFTGASVITTTYANDILGLTQVLIADDGTSQVVNLFGLDLIQQDDGNGALALLADGLGSVRLEMKGGAVEATTTYSPYGKELVQEGDRGTVYGFTGEQEDGATGLLYLRARYYSSSLKTFMSRDPWEGTGWRPGTMNGFSYVLDAPVNRVDPLGLCEYDPYDPYLDYDCWLLAKEIAEFLGEDWQFIGQTSYFWLVRMREELLSGRYIKTQKYGWFDKQHIVPDKGRYIIDEVEKAIGQPCGHSFSMLLQTANRFPQRGSAEFLASYWVSGNVVPAQVKSVALGIYMDYEMRWESFQGEVQIPLSNFSNEDLPSDYLGFFMATRGMEKNYENLLQVFRYLAPIEVSCDTPILCSPHLLPRNREFRPLVRIGGQWVNNNWPPELLLPRPDSSGLWRFEASTVP